MDIALIQQDDGSFDVAMDGPDLALDGGLQTAVILSLFCDARARPDDKLPGGPNDDRRGYWGDAYADVPGDVWGSRLWLLERAVCDQETLNLAQEYTGEALQWMIDDGIASTIDITCSYPCTGRMLIEGNIHKPDGTVESFSYWRSMKDAV